MLRALNYMHQNNIVHRDIKPDNVVYSETADKSQLVIKLIDFGFSQKSASGTKNLTESVGTPYFIAPEII